MSDADGIISKTLLKCKSGEFEVESIHSLKLRDFGISDLGCLGECTGLEQLDLSRNDISRLHHLAGLTNLTYLNLSANRITSIEGLQALENLQSLNLAGNLIGSVDNLRCLCGLDKLQNLRLRDTVNGLTNPMCMNSGYLKDILYMFPNLTTLDGERVKGKGSEVYQMLREIDEAIEANARFNAPETPRPIEWIPEGFWTPSNQFERSSLGDAEQQLADLLSSCSRLSTKAEEKMKELKSSS